MNTSCAETLLILPSQYLDKRLFVQLNGNRKVLGVLRGYDVGGVMHKACGPVLMTSLVQVFLNIVLDDAVEEKAGGEKVRLGMVVSGMVRKPCFIGSPICNAQVLRGNSVVMLEVRCPSCECSLRVHISLTALLPGSRTNWR